MQKVTESVKINLRPTPERLQFSSIPGRLTPVARQNIPSVNKDDLTVKTLPVLLK
ncbi:MAG: hypothetical protein AVDCRST_MAG95-3024 [uncultured Adhaeribacter sp.]|uniref:Uncharacterized protein n=1 Tax=uncultured Adhaeribacter sp. TaxID=448109 RepID=A0A6J4JD66_9BACT|nr:MAG: hypothetical protein AVDCRST_MAG95-3024 [uncultured Adhaeribacter sp.]